MKITINEIARLANVSKSTVSKVLNGYPGINQKTRERVLKVVKEMQYEPNTIARALSSKRTGNIGLLIPHTPEYSVSGAYWSTFISCITASVTEHDYHLLLLLPHEEGRLERIFKAVIKRGIVDGLIIGSEFLDKYWLGELLHHRIPFVMLGRNPEFVHYAVDIDNRKAAYEATSHLVQRGYTRIALVAGPESYFYNLQRAEGYQDALRRHGMTYHRTLYLPYENYPFVHTSIASLFAESPPPDALLVAAGGDFMLEVLQALEETGHRPPEVGFLTFDDYRYLDHTSPPITAVAQPMGRMSRKAVEMLMALLKKEEPPAKEELFPATLVERESTRGPR
ncbi:LacI family DNA-binding transcriptional regulator [Spirochaeta thermophila]|uniref:HTH-type transcriptional regulator CelR n=1 Tax=Winmispira thermophila (strain ATCC 49972 / DSM 6192 / RI 19.B1) TaxID=665571 RepID=E0RU13_WINT6|nr:LacI family DNA-binding transcriptional regulator [Spirochaeta thermophila]ADN01069.1 HTH-type transcriptional regulator CelR [Spirochaeta thermophila DSM 6192]